MGDHTHDHDLGFSHDLPKMLGRRQMLTLLGAAGLSATALPAAAAACVALPWETAGPYPGDGTNAKNGSTINVLTQQGVIRHDLRPSFGAFTRKADGVQLDLQLALVGADGCTPLAGHATYLWHCDAEGKYSLYDVTDANWLRGVAVADADGMLSFTTLFPGCYDGRWPHIHFEIFTSIEAAVSGKEAILTAQIAMPEAEASAVYAADARYPSGTENLSHISIATDNVFSDNNPAQIAQQTVTLTGSVEGGYSGWVKIPVDFNADRSTAMQPPPGAMPPPPRN